MSVLVPFIFYNFRYCIHAILPGMFCTLARERGATGSTFPMYHTCQVYATHITNKNQRHTYIYQSGLQMVRRAYVCTCMI